jgi:hypothetical protein
MADLALVYFSAQLGVESTPGTSVAANRLMQSLGFSRLKGQGEGTMFRPQGSKLDTTSVPPGVRWCQIDFAGIQTYNEIEYILNSALNTVTPTTDGTNGKKWTHTLTKAAADVKTTYTFESGNATHAQKATFAQVNSLKLEMSRESTAVSGTMIAQQLQDAITITPTPTEISPIIVAPQTFNVYIGDTQAGISGTPFARPFATTLTIDGLVDPLTRMNSTDNSYIGLIEQAPSITLEFEVGADTADMAFLTNMTAGTTKFFRVKALGDVIAGAIPSQYTFNCDFSGKIIKHYDPTERGAAATSKWTIQGVYDPTWTKLFEIYNINVLAAL